MSRGDDLVSSDAESLVLSSEEAREEDSETVGAGLRRPLDDGTLEVGRDGREGKERETEAVDGSDLLSHEAGDEADMSELDTEVREGGDGGRSLEENGRARV